MDFKHVYSMARKAPEFEGLTNKEFVIYRTAFRNGFRSGAALRQKIKKVIIPNKPADILSRLSLSGSSKLAVIPFLSAAN